MWSPDPNPPTRQPTAPLGGESGQPPSGGLSATDAPQPTPCTPPTGVKRFKAHHPPTVALNGAHSKGRGRPEEGSAAPGCLTLEKHVQRQAIPVAGTDCGGRLNCSSTGRVQRKCRESLSTLRVRAWPNPPPGHWQRQQQPPSRRRRRASPPRPIHPGDFTKSKEGWFQVDPRVQDPPAPCFLGSTQAGSTQEVGFAISTQAVFWIHGRQSRDHTVRSIQTAPSFAAAARACGIG